MVDRSGCQCLIEPPPTTRLAQDYSTIRRQAVPRPDNGMHSRAIEKTYLGQIKDQALRVAAHKIVEILRHVSVGDRDRQRLGR
jgi:hypothetical protein